MKFKKVIFALLSDRRIRRWDMPWFVQWDNNSGRFLKYKTIDLGRKTSDYEEWNGEDALEEDWEILPLISYSTNWMGPINYDWIRENGDYWSGGRIDVHGVPDEPYGWEMALPTMHNKSYGLLQQFLLGFRTEEVLTHKQLFTEFERTTGHEIIWFDKNRYEDLV